MQMMINPNAAYAYEYPVYINWAAACLAMLESGVDEQIVRDMSAYAHRRVEMLELRHDMPVQVERGWASQNMIAGKGRWDVTNYIANPETGRVDRLCVMLAD